MIHIAKPIIEDEEIAAVKAVLKTGVLAQGPKVAELEEAFANYCGTKFAVAVSSGTAAIHAALYALGVGEGDEVITTPFSFIATANPIIMVGAKPVFVDIEKDSYNLDPSKIEAKITNKTKAIMPVHLYGQPANMDAVQAIAKKHNLLIIEDACQAVGAEYKGKKAGNLGDIGCFSLYATKNIMCGEGGIITTNNQDYVARIKQFRQHGMSGPYQYEGLGYNYRLTDLQAAIAVEQTKKIDRFSSSRQNNAAVLSKGLTDIKGLVIPVVSNDLSHVFHQYTLRVTKDFSCSRDELIEVLRTNEIGAGVYYPKPLHLVEHISKLGYKVGDFPEAEKACQQVISLPIHPGLNKKDLAHMISALKGLQ